MKIQHTGLVILSCLITTAASAHVGHIPQDAAFSLAAGHFSEGLLHPLTGLDHLLAMLAVGMYGAVSASKQSVAILAPLSFASLLLVGAVLGALGMRLPAVEPMIAVSVLVFGLLLVMRTALPLATSTVLIGLFALFHGVAHGSEMPSSASLWAFMIGMMLMTFMLHICGLAMGGLMRRQQQTWTRLTGGAVAVAGLGLLLQTI